MRSTAVIQQDSVLTQAIRAKNFQLNGLARVLLKGDHHGVPGPEATRTANLGKVRMEQYSDPADVSAHIRAEELALQGNHDFLRGQFLCGCVLVQFTEKIRLTEDTRFPEQRGFRVGLEAAPGSGRGN